VVRSARRSRPLWSYGRWSPGPVADCCRSTGYAFGCGCARQYVPGHTGPRGPGTSGRRGRYSPAVTGRHREQLLLPYEADGAGDGTGLRWKIGVALGVVVVIAAAAVFALVGVYRQAGEPTARPPERAPVTGATPAPRELAPSVYPTYGEFVPAAPVRPAATTSPSTAPTRTEGPGRQHGNRKCPRSWRDYPALVEWCKRHGYSTD
jgi:hypothetical protein